jgi:uncharacterized membrane protein
MVFAALFAALTFCATIVMPIKTLTGGYVHLGDSLVLLSGWILGPVWGTLAAAVGSALADLIGGYSTYILPTFIIKGLMALVAWVIMKLFSKKSFVFAVLSGIVGGVIMVGGYYIVEATFLGYGFAGALVSVVPNIVQAVFCVLSASVLFKILSRNKFVSEFIR